MAKLNFAEQTFGTGKSWNVISQCHNCRFRVKYVNFVIKPSAQTRRPTPCHFRFIRLSSITGHLLIPRREATRAGDVLHTTGQTLTIIRTDSAWFSTGQAHKHRSGGKGLIAEIRVANAWQSLWLWFIWVVAGTLVIMHPSLLSLGPTTYTMVTEANLGWVD